MDDELNIAARGPGRVAQLGNLTRDDLVWIGSDGALDPTSIVDEFGYDPTDPLSAILLAIIDAYPSVAKQSRLERLEIAMSALMGRPRKRGMDNKEDHEYLTQIARQYFRAFIDRGRVEPDLAPLIRQVVSSQTDSPQTISGMDSRVRRLRKKFIANKDKYLVWLTMQGDWNSMDAHRKTQKIVAAMQRLGIQIKATNRGATDADSIRNELTRL